MNKPIKILASVCSAGVLLGCASAEKTGETKIVPLMEVKHSTESADAYYALGRYLHGSRRYDEARKAYQHALQLDPRYARAGNALAVLYAETGDLQRATEFMHKLIAENPDTAYLIGNLGYVLFLGGQYQAAQTELERAVALDPQDARAWHNLGSVMEKQGQAERARRMFAQARAARLGKAAPPEAGADAPSPLQSSASGRTEIAHAGPGIYELRQAGTARETREAKGKETDLAADARARPARVEVSNGNGVNGLAKSVGMVIGGDGLKVVRLTNQKRFNVRASRIEYKSGYEHAARALAQALGQPVQLEPGGALATADLRLVLGRDMRDANALRAHYQPARGVAESAGDGRSMEGLTASGGGHPPMQ